MASGVISLSTRLTRIGAALLAIALISIGSTLWITWQIDGGAAAVNEAGRMRMQTWRITSMLQRNIEPDKLIDFITELDTSLLLLKRGDPSRPLYVPWDDRVQKEFDGIVQEWNNLRNAISNSQQHNSDEKFLKSVLLVEAIDKFVTTIEKNLTELTAILNLLQFLMMTLALTGAAIMLYTGYMYVINPLQSISHGLSKLGTGDFAVRVDVGTRDEFGQLADGFNRMAATLQSLYGKLEIQVENKTKHIEAQRLRLQALYDVSAFVATVNSFDELSKGFVEKVRKISKADASAIRWSDETGQRYMMLATNCFPTEIAAEERSILAGACSCGSSGMNTKTRVIPIARLDDPPMKRCAKAGYQSLVTVPVRHQQKVVGEINLFFREPVTLSVEEVDLLDTLGSHLANAMESMRAIALEKEAAVVEERVLIASELHDSIAQSLVFLRIQSQLIRESIENNKSDFIQAEFDELDEGISECLSDVRELLIHFRIRNDSGDIDVALMETLRKFERQTGISTNFISTGHAIPLAPDVQVQVLHILQEALSNVRKHANATKVVVNVSKTDVWSFEVSDDGVGFDIDHLPGDDHVGMRIMRERASRINAKIMNFSTHGQGAVTRLVVPVSSDASVRST